MADNHLQLPKSGESITSKQTASSKSNSFKNSSVNWNENQSISKIELVDYEQEILYHLLLQCFLSPLTEPLLRGWRRVIDKGQGGDQLHYISPGGKQLSSLSQVEEFLFKTKSKLKVDQFTLDRDVSLHSRPLPQKYRLVLKFIDDLSKGTENKPIICFNNINMEMPPEFTYISSSKRLLHADVSISTDSSFMTSCDCTDGCVNSKTCTCRQLTESERQGLVNMGDPPSDGYIQQRLRYPQVSAIYECNQYCKCGSQCSNKVVQNGIRHRLAVYMTEKMCGVFGLGSNDAGRYTSRTGEKRGMAFGDEYLTELDYIDVMEGMKEGYEEDVVLNDTVISSSGDASLFPTNRSLVGKDVAESIQTSNRLLETTISTPNLSILSSPDSGSSHSLSRNTENTPSEEASFFCIKSVDTERTAEVYSEHSSGVNISCRHYFGEDSSCYVIDSNSHGNIGRFFNISHSNCLYLLQHSCSPNLFVQNVFVDTHDLRFPWVAFFASKNINAFTELFWDYNYVIGSVEGRSLKCLCGSANCRTFLL